VKIWQAYEKNNREGTVIFVDLHRLYINYIKISGIRSSNGVYPVWKCVCTISGYHTQAIYDVKW